MKVEGKGILLLTILSRGTLDKKMGLFYAGLTCTVVQFVNCIKGPRLKG